MKIGFALKLYDQVFMRRILNMLFLFLGVIFCVGQVKKSPDKNIHLPKPDFSDTTYRYYPELYQNKNKYFLYVSAAMYTGNLMADGDLTNYNTSQLFFGYDTSIVIIKGNELIPKAIGHTSIYLRNPDDSTVTADSMSVKIFKSKGKLLIKETHRVKGNK
jgi:hypothetical protein